MLTRNHIQTLLFALMLLVLEPHAAKAQAPDLMWENTIGQMVFTPDMISNHMHINISDWPSGVYFVEVITEVVSYVKQVVLE